MMSNEAIMDDEEVVRLKHERDALQLVVTAKRVQLQTHTAADPGYNQHVIDVYEAQIKEKTAEMRARQKKQDKYCKKQRRKETMRGLQEWWHHMLCVTLFCQHT